MYAQIYQHVCQSYKGLSGTKRDFRETVRTAGSNALFAALREISDNVLSGAETNGFNGMVTGFHQGILSLAMEPTLWGATFVGGGNKKIELTCSPGDDEQQRYIEGYLQAMLDTRYRIECLRVSVAEDQVFLKNLPANTSIINEIVENVKGVLVSKNLLEGNGSTAAHPFRHLQRRNQWRLGPAVQTLCEHLFVHYTIHKLHKEARKFLVGIRSKTKKDGDKSESSEAVPKKNARKRALGRFVLSSMFAYVNGWLCRRIPSRIARRIISGFFLKFLDHKSSK